MRTLKPVIVFLVLFFLPGVVRNTGNVFAEAAVVYANRGWQRTDVILKGSCNMTWKVCEGDCWSFNPEIFPNGHSAEGLKVPALHSYALKGENIGMLLGRVGGGRIISMGKSGSSYVTPIEGGEYLYLTMNDDLIGLYAAGYKDNVGELLVSIKQIRLKPVQIDLLFVEGCSGYEAAMKLIEEIVHEKGISADINLIQVDNAKEAGRLQFVGSPTVRVGGMDVENDLMQTMSYGLKNRLYCRQGNTYSYPSKGRIESAILRGAEKNKSTKMR
ncbi:MAG: hypothetical protein GY941_10410 [Planctomycetes bacterium]|nr:hypothetical protein [Planctomycetota bacterium]